MNLTILSLVSASIISHSPLHVSNNIKAINCNYQKFFTKIFFNQQSFFIKNTKFQYGISGTIKVDGSINSQTFSDSFYGTYQTIKYDSEVLSNPIQLNPSIKSSYSIIGCTFANIKNFNDHIIQVTGQASFYISDSLLAHSSGSKDPISLVNSRCNTITHVCCSDVTVKNGSSFLFGSLTGKDFFVFLYSTIIGNRKVKDIENEETVIFTKYGTQYNRCINISNCDPRKAVIQIETPRCYSQDIFTFSNIGSSIMQISGTLKEDNKILDTFQLTSGMISAYNLNTCEYLSTDFKYGLFVLDCKDVSHFEYHIKNCAFIYGNSDKCLFLITDNSKDLNIRIDLVDCSISSDIRTYLNKNREDKVTVQKDSNVREVPADQITIFEVAHYTAPECKGIDLSDKKELNCRLNIDKCLNKHNCISPMSFPSDVAPYTTKFYPEAQQQSDTQKSSPFKLHSSKILLLSDPISPFPKKNSNLLLADILLDNNDDDNNNENSGDSCKFRLYAIYALLIVVFILIIVIVVLSLLIWSRHRAQNLSVDEDLDETNNNDLEESLTNDDPFVLSGEDNEEHADNSHE